MTLTTLRHPTPVTGVSLQQLLSRTTTTLRLWHDRARQRRQLVELSPEQLRDIGVSHGDAQLEADKPFWQA